MKWSQFCKSCLSLILQFHKLKCPQKCSCYNTFNIPTLFRCEEDTSGQLASLSVLLALQIMQASCSWELLWIISFLILTSKLHALQLSFSSRDDLQRHILWADGQSFLSWTDLFITSSTLSTTTSVVHEGGTQLQPPWLLPTFQPPGIPGRSHNMVQGEQLRLSSGRPGGCFTKKAIKSMGLWQS